MDGWANLVRSAESLSLPAPISGGHVGKVEVDAILGNSEHFMQQTADILGKLAVHVIIQSANAAEIRKGGLPWLAGHQDGGRSDRDHDVILGLADGLRHDFGQGCKQSFLFIIGKSNGGLKS
jgi:hypothetical protein